MAQSHPPPPPPTPGAAQPSELFLSLPTPQPSPPPPPPAPSFWRRVAEYAGIDDDLDAAAATARMAQHWIQSKLPQPAPEQVRLQEALDRQLQAHAAEGARQREETWAGVKRFFGSEPVQRAGQQLKADYQHLWTPPADVTAMAGMARQAITERSDAMRAALPQTPEMKPIDWMLAAQNDWIPNFAVDSVAEATSPVGAVTNLDLPIGPALHAAAGAVPALGHAAAAVPFIPGVRRPTLNKATRAAVEEARRHLQDVGLQGPVPREVLETVLKEPPLVGHAHRVTKDLPVEEPLRRANRILRPSDAGYDFSPPATARLHGMADIGAALPHQANWGGATDPALLSAFNNDPEQAALFGRFFAALSPRTSVPKNALEALNVWRDYLRNPRRKITDARLRQLGVGNVRSKTDNITRAILGEDPSGEKVDLFTDYMIGNSALPVPDVHGLYAIGSRHGSIDSVIPELRRIVQTHEGIPAARGGLTDKDYVRRLVDAFGRSLQSYDPEKPMGPLFGSTWEGTRAQKGLPFQGGMIDIYKSRGLAEPGALFDERAIRQAIRDWSKR